MTHKATPTERLLLRVAGHIAVSIEQGGWSATGGFHDELRALIALVERDIERRPPASSDTGALTLEDVMAAIDDLEAKVTAQETVIASTVTLLAELNTELKGALANNDTARIQALTARIDADQQKLAAAVAANTPAASSTGTAASAGTVSSAGTSNQGTV